MPLGRRLIALTALALSVGCSKSLAPSTPIASHASSNGVSPGPAADVRVRLQFVGTRVTLGAGGVPIVNEHETFFVTGPNDIVTDPLETVPGRARLLGWQWFLATTGGTAHAIVVDDPTEPLPPTVPTDTTSVALPPGIHSRILDVPAALGGGQVRVSFRVGFSPDAWFAGPDPASWPASTDGDGRAVGVLDWNTFTTSPAWPPDGRGFLGPDSLRHIPSVRRAPGEDVRRRTFYEIFGDRIYARSEGDAVHLGSWIVAVSGGYDSDSPYTPRVVAGDPALPPDFATNPAYPVLQSLGLVGAPIGFRSRMVMKLGNGTVLQPSETTMHPVYDPFSVFRFPDLASTWRAQFPGTAYLVLRAQDSDGLLSPPIDDPIGTVAHVDAGGGTPEERAARQRIVVFTVRDNAP